MTSVYRFGDKLPDGEDSEVKSIHGAGGEISRLRVEAGHNCELDDLVKAADDMLRADNNTALKSIGYTGDSLGPSNGFSDLLGEITGDVANNSEESSNSDKNGLIEMLTRTVTDSLSFASDTVSISGDSTSSFLTNLNGSTVNPNISIGTSGNLSGVAGQVRDQNAFQGGQAIGQFLGNQPKKAADSANGLLALSGLTMFNDPRSIFDIGQDAFGNLGTVFVDKNQILDDIENLIDKILEEIQNIDEDWFKIDKNGNIDEVIELLEDADKRFSRVKNSLKSDGVFKESEYGVGTQDLDRAENILKRFKVDIDVDIGQAVDSTVSHVKIISYLFELRANIDILEKREELVGEAKKIIDDFSFEINAESSPGIDLNITISGNVKLDVNNPGIIYRVPLGLDFDELEELIGGTIDLHFSPPLMTMKYKINSVDSLGGILTVSPVKISETVGFSNVNWTRSEIINSVARSPKNSISPITRKLKKNQAQLVSRMQQEIKSLLRQMEPVNDSGNLIKMLSLSRAWAMQVKIILKLSKLIGDDIDDYLNLDPDKFKFNFKFKKDLIDDFEFPDTSNLLKKLNEYLRVSNRRLSFDSKVVVDFPDVKKLAEKNTKKAISDLNLPEGETLSQKDIDKIYKDNLNNAAAKKSEEITSKLEVKLVELNSEIHSLIKIEKDSIDDIQSKLSGKLGADTGKFLKIQRMMKNAGFDRATDLLCKGSLSEYLDLTSQKVTQAGNLVEKLNCTLKGGLVDLNGSSVGSVQSANIFAVKRYIEDKNRAKASGRPSFADSFKAARRESYDRIDRNKSIKDSVDKIVYSAKKQEAEIEERNNIIYLDGE
jgi:hypothetical protein